MNSIIEIYKNLSHEINSYSENSSIKYDRYYYVAKAIMFVIKMFTKKVIIAGSLRRGVENPGDIDLLVVMKKGLTLDDIRYFLVKEFNVKINWAGLKKMQIEVDNIKVDFKISTSEQLGAGLLYFTGSGKFNICMRGIAKSKGFKLNEYGLWKENVCVASKTEKDIFKALDMKYLKPNERI